MSHVVDKNGVKLPDAIMVIEYKGCKIMHSSEETLVYIGTHIRQCVSIEDAINVINSGVELVVRNSINYTISTVDYELLGRNDAELQRYMMGAYVRRWDSELRKVTFIAVTAVDVARCNKVIDDNKPKLTR